jgi:hypothetical protein
MYPWRRLQLFLPCLRLLFCIKLELTIKIPTVNYLPNPLQFSRTPQTDFPICIYLLPIKPSLQINCCQILSTIVFLPRIYASDVFLLSPLPLPRVSNRAAMLVRRGGVRNRLVGELTFRSFLLLDCRDSSQDISLSVKCSRRKGAQYEMRH